MARPRQRGIGVAGDSIDTNILLYAQNRDCGEQAAAVAFLTQCARRDDMAICELVLVELYQLLRNPAVLERPLEAPEAAGVCQAFRRNPRWALIKSAPVMDRVWTLPPGGACARDSDPKSRGPHLARDSR